MKITRISKIRNHRIFRDFTWPATLPAFGRFNVIYGWNGSGKSTLSNIFRSIEKQSPIADGEVRIDIDGVIQQASTFSSTSSLPRVKVFNRDFVEENVFSSNQAISPIFFLGKESKDKQEEVERLRRTLNDPGGLVESSRKAKNEIVKVERELDAYCVSQGGLVREILRSSGSNPYNHYDKSDYRKMVESLLVDGLESAKSKRLTDIAKEELKAKASATPRAFLSEPMLDISDLSGQSQEIDQLLKRTVVSSILPALKSNNSLESWVRFGLPLHGLPRSAEKPLSSQCGFCNQTLTPERVAQLEGHFNDQYKRLTDDIDAAALTLQRKRVDFKLAELPKKVEINEHLADKYAADLESLTAEVDRHTTYIAALLRAVEDKRTHPFEPVSVAVFSAGVEQPEKALADEIAARLLGYIKTHNTECKDFEAMVASARRALEEALVADSVEDYELKKAAEATARTDENSMAVRIAETTAKIAELEREIFGHHQAADELNEELKRYLGRDELKFRSEGKGYAIMRAGQPAKNLSEGEKTAIAFLYFLKALQDKDFTIGNDIVVIDDPVSSLDANALFCAFGYMKERTKEAGQLFILTHNFGFFRQVKNWFYWINGGPKSNGKDAATLKARFYMVECQDSVGGRNGQICALDSLLWEYESEYHYLFKKVFEGANRVPPATLESYYGLPNIARRLLESFLSFRYPNHSGLREQLDELKCDPGTRSRVVRFVHTYSHEGAAAEEHDPTVLSETPAVLREILDLIKNEDPGHYTEMMALIGVAPATPPPAVPALIP